MLRWRGRIKARRDTEGQKCPPRDRFRKMAQRDKKQGQHFLTSLFWVAKHTVFLPDYKDIQRTAKINIPKETKIGCRSSLASQRIQKCARIRVNECEYTKNWKNVFADVCIFYFWRQLHLQIFVYFPSLGIVSVPLNRVYKHWLSATYICR